MDAIPLQQIRDEILSVTGGLHGGLDSAIYLQQIRDAILSVTGTVFGSLNEAIYLQQIRDAVLGVTTPTEKYGSLNSVIYLQQIRDAYLSVTPNPTGGLDEGIYLGEIFANAIPPGPQYETPSYANAGGAGDRTASITVSVVNFTGVANSPQKIVDGINVIECFWENQAIAGKYVSFQFSQAVLITEAKLYITAGFDGYAATSWKWQGSQNGTDWTDIGPAFTPAVGVPKTFTSMSGNTNAYIYYRMIGVSGSTTLFETWNEMEFKIGNPL